VGLVQRIVLVEHPVSLAGTVLDVFKDLESKNYAFIKS
jgi:hypothetical protein